MEKEEIDIHDTSQVEKNVDGAISIQCTGGSILQSAFLNLGLNQEQVEYMLVHGRGFLGKPQILGRKLKISGDLAVKALEILKNSQQLTNEDIEKIKICLEDNPDLVDSPEDIALLSEVDQRLVLEYFERQPLTNTQKELIGEKFEKGNSANEIYEITKIPPTKIKEYIESTFATFSGEEGNKVFQILNSLCGGISMPSLRNKLKQGDLKLQDRLISIQHTTNTDYKTVEQYLTRYAETQGCLKVEQDLNIDEILLIKQSNKDNIEALSPKLNKIESVIRNYFHQYFMHPVEDKYFKEQQENQIKKLSNAFENILFSLDDYRTIATHPFNDIIYSIKTRNKSKRVEKLLVKLLPYALYLLKCNLPLEEIAHIISNKSNIPLTTHDIFHIIFQLSDSVLRGLCIEHYSFSNPVPLYYPRLKLESRRVEFEICKELWYCLEQYNGLISFGLGRASWNAVGKSTLLDLIFETDFVKGSPQNSAFHYQSIDIQLTRNIFGETKERNSEPTKWAYIDCHHYSNFDMIQSICSHLDVALIHVCVDDYKNNRIEIEKELSLCTSKYIYILLRDCECDDINVRDEIVNGTRQRIVYIPDLTKKDPRLLRDSFKSIGYEIFSKSIHITKLIQSQFILEILQDFEFSAAKELQSNKELVENITQKLNELGEVDFNIFHYYPQYVEYMRSFNQASCEVDQNTIDKLNSKCNQLDEKLRKTQVGEMPILFYCIFQKENFPLILWKLSRELIYLSEILNLKRDIGEIKFGEQRNAKYTIELLWRETLLFYKYAENDPVNETYRTYFTSNYSNFVENGGAFELIDGDNLRFFIKEIDALLSQYYKKQTFLLRQINERQSIRIKPAPIVVSILGPQSSGKSTLLNYCFGCNFLTSAGRCTKGIYGSLSKLDRPVNLSQSLLILDTEGLDGIERDNIKDTSMIHFDRTMVLFCLAVSQVVIINVRGDIGSEMLNLLQICAYSLNRLKVNKVKAPKIFFVLNQQADPDIDQHLHALNILMEKLNKSAIMDSDGVKTSDLIQISIKNMFILPFAFNSEKLNKSSHNQSNVIKLSPTVAFADKCTDLRLAIIDELDHLPLDDRAPFRNMSEWMEMAGVIWDTIIKYQDIIKCRNLEELASDNKLDEIVSVLIKTYFHDHHEEFAFQTTFLCEKISFIESYTLPEILLIEYMAKFDEVFDTYYNPCMREFSEMCQRHNLLRKMKHICDVKKSNLKRLIYAIRNKYETDIDLHIKSVMTEINLSESMQKLQLAITQNMEKYSKYSTGEVEDAFEEIWKGLFGNEGLLEEENRECKELFSKLYSSFKMECNIMEENNMLFQLFQTHKFNIDHIIDSLKKDIFKKFTLYPSDQMSQFVNTVTSPHPPIKDMRPYNGGKNYSYLCQNSLYKTDNIDPSKVNTTPKLKLLESIPTECESFLQLCSGYYNLPDIIWKVNQTTQANILISSLKDPEDPKESTWNKFIRDISADALTFHSSDMSTVIVKELVNALCFRIRLLNYEIGFIHASLSNTAEKALFTLVFAYAFKFQWDNKINIRRKDKEEREEEKKRYLKYFMNKIEEHKMISGKWDRDWMTERNKEISSKYASDFIEKLIRDFKNFEVQNLMNLFEDTCRKEFLSYESMLFLAYDRVLEELKKDPGRVVTDTENFVVQYICNRNRIIRELFREKWIEVEDKLYKTVSQNMKKRLKNEISYLNEVLGVFLQDLNDQCKVMGNKFESDNYFEFMGERRGNYVETKEIPFKAMNKYLLKYLNPAVTTEEFKHFLLNAFEVDGVKVKVCDTYRLPCKRSEPVLDEEVFKKLFNTEMFNNIEMIFNIHEYIEHFQSVLKIYNFKLEREEFKKMTQNLKNEFENDVKGCPSRCPSCGKFCEREIHTNEGKCQIKTGHQISSMGGKVWNADEDNTAVLFMCDDYRNYTQISLPKNTLTWDAFKDHCGKEWNWDLPDRFRDKQSSNPKFMKDIWNKYGRGILNYHNQEQGTDISFVPYTSYEEVNEPLLPINYYICFVIDGTGSMNLDITRVRLSVGQLISSFISQGHSAQFRVVIYRDHCDDKLIETFPHGSEFTPEQNSIEDFLNGIRTTGGGDFPEAVLDGLATAATQSDWKRAPGFRNKIIHIFDAPPHGNFPNHTEHKSYSNKRSCCCCNQGSKCLFDWDKDVWNMFKKFDIEYYAINTTPSKFEMNSVRNFRKTIKKKALEYRHWVTIDLIYSKYELKMKQELGHLCGTFQDVGKEVVNDAILKIFVDFKDRSNDLSISMSYDPRNTI